MTGSFAHPVLNIKQEQCMKDLKITYNSQRVKGRKYMIASFYGHKDKQKAKEREREREKKRKRKQRWKQKHARSRKKIELGI